MSAPSRAPLLMLLLLVVVGGALAGALLLLGEDEPGTDGAAAVVGPRAERSAGPVELPAWDGPGPTSPAGAGDAALTTRTRRLAGRLLRLADAAPLAGARLLEPVEQPLGPDGSFDLGAVEADLDQLLVDRPDDGGGLAGGPWVVPLPPPSPDDDTLELTVDTGWIVRGLTRGPDGLPVPGASVVAGLGASERRALSDGAGRFSLEDVVPPEGEFVVVLRARAALHAAAPRRVTLPSTERILEGAVLTLRPAGVLAGRLVGPGGSAVAGATVRLGWIQHPDQVADLEEPASTTSDAQGRYRLEGVPPGLYVVLLEAPGLGLTVVPDIAITAGRESLLDTTLSAAVSLSGVVQDAAGRPVPGAEVSVTTRLSVRTPARSGPLEDVLRGARAHADPDSTPPGRTDLEVQLARVQVGPDGRFQLDDLPARALQLGARSAAHPGWRPRRLTVTVAAGQAQQLAPIVLGGGRIVSGQVLGPDGGGLAGATVALVPGEGTAAVGREDRLSADDQGRFAFEGLSQGPHQLFVDVPGFRSHTQVVQPGGPELVLRLEPAALLRGQVRDAVSGAPVPRFEVRVEDETSWSVRGWDSADGRFVYDTLADVEHTLTVSAEGYRPAVLEGVRPRFGESPELVVELSPGG